MHWILILNIVFFESLHAIDSTDDEFMGRYVLSLERAKRFITTTPRPRKFLNPLCYNNEHYCETNLKACTEEFDEVSREVMCSKKNRCLIQGKICHISKKSKACPRHFNVSCSAPICKNDLYFYCCPEFVAREDVEDYGIPSIQSCYRRHDDPCDAVPCQNYGTCQKVGKSYSCACQLGYDNTTNCGIDCDPGPGDILFLVDSSESTQDNLNKSIDFMEEIVRNLPIGPNDFRIALMTYSFDPEIHFTFDKYNTNMSVISAIRNMKGQRGATFTEKALKAAYQLISNSTAGAREFGKVYKTIILLSDGLSTDSRQALNYAKSFRSSLVISLITIAVGSSIDQTELISIASKKDIPYLFPRKGYDALNMIKKLTMHSDCTNCSLSSNTDILILQDLTVSLKSFPLSISVATEIVNRLIFNSSHVQLGMITFSNSSSPVYKMRLQTITDNVMSTVQNVDRSDGEADIVSALQFLDRQGFLNRNGGRSNSRKVVLILSDGDWKRLSVVKSEIKRMSRKNFRVLMILIDGLSNFHDVNAVMMDPSDLLIIDDKSQFSVLDSIVPIVSYVKCN